MREQINFEVLFDTSPNAYVLLSPALTIIDANLAYLEITERTRPELIGHSLFDAFPGNPDDPDDSSQRLLRASFQRVLSTRSVDVLPFIRYAIPRTGGDGTQFQERFWSVTHTPILDEEGNISCILQHTVDVTELRRMKNTIRASEGIVEGNPSAGLLEESVLRRADQVQKSFSSLDAERQNLRNFFEQAPGFIAFLRGPTHIFELVNEAYYQLVGHRELIGKTVAGALPEVENQGFFELLDRVYASGETYIGREVRVMIQQVPDSELSECYVDFVYQPVIEPDGSVSGIFAQGYEVTEQKLARDQLQVYQNHLEDLVQERTRALEESETALRQAQKMEAIGKLTGGVSHDFNNLLQVIGGNLELLQRDSPASDRVQRRLQAAARAVQKGSRLASQLLAFARRQPLAPRVVNIGRLIRNMDDLLRRSLGERIALEVIIGGGLWNAFVDPHQLENVILNLAVNAHDAMKGEGNLTVEAGNAMLDEHYADHHAEVTPGQYVMLAISDTGCGMSDEIADRAFEPFFTTKPEGEGTGLGLSMTYGFVKQSGGHIKIYSEEDVGTTIRIYLPRTQEEAPEVADGFRQTTVEGGNETILVVEDDAEVRATVVEMLSSLGYRALKVPDGKSALAVLQSGVTVDLLFTDVVMPGPVRSPDLVKRARALRPEMEVLYTSGYTENAVVHDGKLDPGVNFLSKPYRLEDLARRIRHLLVNRRQRLTGSGDRPEMSIPERQRPEELDVPPALRVLVVEDDELVRMFIGEALGELGYVIVSVSSAEEAMAAFQENEVDVLFTDVGLTGMSGSDLAVQLRKQRPDLGVILASGYSNVAQAGRGHLKDAIVLPKPFGPVEIENVFERLKVQTDVRLRDNLENESDD